MWAFIFLTILVLSVLANELWDRWLSHKERMANVGPHDD